MLTLYTGRVCMTDRHPRDPAAASRLVEVVAIGPTLVLDKGQVGVDVLEVDRQWRTWLNEGDLQPLTTVQESLREKHGLPHEFAAACWKAMSDGMITHDEARDAISKYTVEFYQEDFA